MINGYVNISKYSSKIIGNVLIFGDAQNLDLEDQVVANELIELSKNTKTLVLNYKDSMNNEGNRVDFNLNLTLNAMYLKTPENEVSVITGTASLSLFIITAYSTGNINIIRQSI